MILKMFQKEAESLISQIETVSRKLQAETQIEGLGAASGHLTAFTATAINAYAKKEAETKEKNKPWKYSDVLLALNSNTQNEMLKTRGWLANPLNQELERWGEALSLLCRAYASFKIGIAYWLPVIGPGELHKLMSWKDTYDPEMLSFLEAIKPAAGNRGTIWALGSQGANIYVRDSTKKAWKEDLGGAGGCFAISNTKAEASPHPDLAIFLLSGEQSAKRCEARSPSRIPSFFLTQIGRNS